MKTHQRVRVFGLLLVAGVFLLPAMSQSRRQRQDDGNILLSSQMQSQSAGQNSQAGQRGDPGNRAAGQAPQVAADDSVPKDLRPLLTPRSSEMRLVALRYNTDRATLNGNYLGGGGRGGGAGRGGNGAPAVSLSPDRIARLKRFDMDWQVALGKIDASMLSVAAKADLDSLKTAVAGNLKDLDTATASMNEVMPVVPFSSKIVQLYEARVRIEHMDAEKAAGVVVQIVKEIGDTRAKLEAGLTGDSAAGAIRVGHDLALRAADATEVLRSSMANWFNFYNGYDPMFTWWMGMPYKQLDAALQNYSTLLRDKVAAANEVSNLPAPTVGPIAAAPAPRFSDVPDLREILAYPQDEMTGVVDRFRGVSAGGGGRRGGRGSAPAHSQQYYQDWLAALKTLDFDGLSRNAQVDYLFLKKTCENQIARASVTLPANPPRKTDDTGIPGAARGREGLIWDLQDEFIPYTPEQLIALANKEFAWCEEEMKNASREMGIGDNWKAALEKVKQSYVPPGGQPEMIRDLLFEAIDYLRAKDLITVPEVAAESLHMTMMTPQQQLSSPFFLGGSEILVSYPTDTMEYDARMQSMRGNNPGFAHATVFHEMIPGHNLQGYMSARLNGYRANLGAGTPFWTEGWALYWETLMYDLGFHKTPAQKVGALFWRMHRCARIIFSLNFHMGLWSPQQCIDFLVDRVGHERDNATAEVRRSFQGGYGPLYQAAYLLGGLELRGLRKELVDSRIETNKQFHDEVLRSGGMPIALIRLALTKGKLTRDMPINWRFYGDLPDK